MNHFEGKKRSRHRLSIITWAVILLVTVLASYSVIVSKVLTVSRYSLDANLNSPIRIVQLTDLHNAEFGRNNERLIALVSEQKPDLIVMTGDMLNRDDENTQIVVNLISDLSGVAPVYYGYGNHETAWEQSWGKNLHEIFSSAGAVVLDNEYVDVSVNHCSLRIGGYMGYYRQPGMFRKSAEQREMEFAFFNEFEDTHRYKILLDHIPTAWIDWRYYNKYPVDLVLCGHYHGGLMRIPFLDQGIYAPYVGWFPENTKGLYEGTKAVCVLSAGLGSEYLIPRINNSPEIVVVDLIP